MLLNLYVQSPKCTHVFGVSDQKIMNELLLHEGRHGGLSGAGPSSAVAGAEADQYTKYSSSSEEEEGGGMGAQSNLDPSEESSDEEFTMKVCSTV